MRLCLIYAPQKQQVCDKEGNLYSTSRSWEEWVFPDSLAGRRPGAKMAKGQIESEPSTPFSWDVDWRQPSLFMNPGGPAIQFFLKPIWAYTLDVIGVTANHQPHPCGANGQHGDLLSHLKGQIAACGKSGLQIHRLTILPLLGPSSGSRNYQQLQSKLRSTVSQCFLVFWGAISKISVRRRVYFFFLAESTDRQTRIASMYLQEQARAGLPVWARFKIKARRRRCRKYGNGMTQWERRVQQRLKRRMKEEPLKQKLWLTHTQPKGVCLNSMAAFTCTA